MQMPDPDPGIIARKAAIVRRLESALPPGTVISDPVELRPYECDAFTAYRCPPLAVVLAGLWGWRRPAPGVADPTRSAGDGAGARASARATPRSGQCRTVAPQARAISAVWSRLPLSTTITSAGATVCRSSARSVPGRNCASLRAGTITENSGTRSR